MERRTYWRMLLAAVFLFLLVPQAAHAAIDPATVQKLLAGDGSAGDSFGSSVAVDGDTAVIGTWAYYPPGGGTAYVFTRVGGIWTEQQKLTASDAAYFGFSVAVDGNTAVIGAMAASPNDLTSAGAAYVFTRVGGIWTEQQKLTASDAAAYDQFGYSVSVDGDKAVIGAPCGLSYGGAVYMFTRVGGVWIEQQKLTASDAAPDDLFGQSMSVSGDTAVIGAPGGLPYTGAAYVFTRAGGVWIEQQKLTAADDGCFGISVSVSGDTAVIGAPCAPGGLSAAGAAYVFTRSVADGTWSQQVKLIADDGGANDSFGSSVAVDGGTVVIGAPCAALGGYSYAGAAYVFTHAGGIWIEQQKLTAFDAAPDGLFGWSVSLDGDTVVIGAIGAFPGDNPVAVGAAYLLSSALDQDSDGDGVPDSSDNCLTTPNPDQQDTDGDGLGDACDLDNDNDGVPDATDNCLTMPNPDQQDKDSDGIGDACDSCPADADNDKDIDGICGNIDNCPTTPNADQQDADGDGLGDACDAVYDPLNLTPIYKLLL